MPRSARGGRPRPAAAALALLVGVGVVAFLDRVLPPVEQPPEGNRGPVGRVGQA